MVREKETLAYYERNTDQYVLRTMNADMGDAQARFLSCLPEKALILDFGCGSGRDTKTFLDAGCDVEAVDGSEEICVRASEYTGIQVKRMLFSELDADSRYDGIWACASILHLPRTELASVLGRMEKALKTGGVLYTSFKYGTYEGMRNGRYFSDFTEETLKEFWKDATSLRIFDLWTAEDALPEKRDQLWLDLLARKD